jgi:nitrogenase molybdenum-cofactor synthesis protein NifE
MDEVETRELMTATAQRCHDPYLRCAFYGAAQTALGVTGCCTIAHSPQGCYLLVDAAFGWQDADYTETHILSTKLCEDGIVHGGEDTLARTILEAQELEVPIMFVISACGPEIVGDDIVAVCEDMRSQVNFEIVPIESAGIPHLPSSRM